MKNNNSLILKLYLYGFFVLFGFFYSSVTRKIDYFECCLLLFIILMVSTQRLNVKYFGVRAGSNFFGISLAFFLYCISISLLIALINNNDANLILRDIVALCLFFIFLFFSNAIVDSPKNTLSMLKNGFLIAGTILSLRFYYYIFIDNSARIENDGSTADYLAIEISVCFSAFYFLIRSIYYLNIKCHMASLGSLFLSFICIAPAFMIVYRFPMISYLVMLFFAVILLRKWAYKFLYLVLLILLFASLDLHEAINNIYSKFALTGVNGRSDEYLEVLKLIFENPSIFLIGLGWGAVFYSPIFDDHVTFTHNFTLYLFVKVGILGFIYSIYIIFTVYFKIIWVLSLNFVHNFNNKKLNVEYSVGLSLVFTYVGVFYLQASYKSITVGLLIALGLAFLKIMKNKSIINSHDAIAQGRPALESQKG